MPQNQPYTFTGTQSRRNEDGDFQSFDFSDSDILYLARQTGYKGPKEGAAGYAVGARNALGNLVNLAGGERAPDRTQQFNSVLKQHGIDPDYLPLIRNDLHYSLTTRDPEARKAVDAYTSTLKRGFSMEPWMIAAAPFLVGGGMALAGAGAAGAGVGGMAAADAAGLATMAADAGLTGAAADAFVASGGTLGSTAAAGSTMAETFIDPWDAMGDKTMYGLDANPGVTSGAPGVEGATPGGSTPAPTAPGPSPMEIPPSYGADLGTAYGSMTPAAGSGGGPGGGGLINDVINWGKNNQFLASTIAGQGMSFIRDALAPSPEETFRAQYQARLDAEKAFDEWRRNNNSLEGVNVNRLRPRGQPQSQKKPGLINGAMK